MRIVDDIFVMNTVTLMKNICFISSGPLDMKDAGKYLG